MISFGNSFVLESKRRFIEEMRQFISKKYWAAWFSDAPKPQYF